MNMPDVEELLTGARDLAEDIQTHLENALATTSTTAAQRSARRAEQLALALAGLAKEAQDELDGASKP